MRVNAAIVETAEPPVYRQIAPRVAHLRELGLSARAIARALGVSAKTVAKAVDAPSHPSIP